MRGAGAAEVVSDAVGCSCFHSEARCSGYVHGLGEGDSDIDNASGSIGSICSKSGHTTYRWSGGVNDECFVGTKRASSSGTRQGKSRRVGGGIPYSSTV